MKHTVHDAKVLVASDNADDARQIQYRLKGDFTQVQLSTDADCSLSDFEHPAADGFAAGQTQPVFFLSSSAPHR